MLHCRTLLSQPALNFCNLYYILCLLIISKKIWSESIICIELYYALVYYILEYIICIMLCNSQEMENKPMIMISRGHGGAYRKAGENELVSPKECFSNTFAENGAFSLHCHPTVNDMQPKII